MLQHQGRGVPAAHEQVKSMVFVAGPWQAGSTALAQVRQLSLIQLESPVIWSVSRRLSQ
jgi:hypothetical protein